jgi:hypothetical protein
MTTITNIERPEVVLGIAGELVEAIDEFLGTTQHTKGFYSFDVTKIDDIAWTLSSNVTSKVANLAWNFINEPQDERDKMLPLSSLDDFERAVLDILLALHDAQNAINLIYVANALIRLDDAGKRLAIRLP